MAGRSKGTLVGDVMCDILAGCVSEVEALVRRRGHALDKRGAGHRLGDGLRAHGEDEQPGVDLPEAATADEHVGPGLRVIGLSANGRVLGGNEAHALEFL